MGLTTSEATRLFLHSVVLHKGLPFELRIPNEETVTAIKETQEGKNIIKHASPKELFDDLGLECIRLSIIAFLKKI